MSSSFGPMVLICNPRAGGGGAARAMAEVRRHLENRELAYDVVFTQRPGHATELTRQALDRGCKFVVAVGGDGTIHEVVNGLIQDDRAVDPDAVMGVVAAGTGADFIKTFGIPSMPGHAVAHLDGPQSFPIDVGKITYTQDEVTAIRYFANIAEVGLGASVVDRAARLPRLLGPTRYVVAYWLTLRGHKPAEVTVDLVDRSYTGPMNNLVVANGQFFGGGMKIAPRAAPTDGVFDIQIEHASKWEEIAVMPRVYSGQHVPHPDIFEAKRVRASIQSVPALQIEADGELLGRTPASFELLKDVIRLKV
ncbi:MAG: diacylglycerol kinase [Actinomycetota bacterium]|jgi:YegS/Rv2252/BmrU family lipid kinase|nr:diacylglycerol kinase [Actinomycetota bacterium]